MHSDKQFYPLASGQFGLILSQIFTIEPLTARSANYINAYFRVPEGCDFEALQGAFNRVVEQNDALRLRVVARGFGIYQYVEDYAPRRLDIVRIEDSDEAREAYVRGVLRHHTRLFGSDLVWAQMAQSGSGGILLMQFHHMCADGYSLGLILKALERYYDCLAQGTELPQEKAYSVTRFFEGEAKYLKSSQFEKDSRFWKEAFNNQRDYKMPAGHRFPLSVTSSQSISFSGRLYQRLRAFYRANNCSTQTAIMALLAMLIYSDTDARNFAICSASHNRNSPALRQTVGCMLNTCVTFFDVDVDMPFDEFLRDSHMRILTHLSHGRTPITVQEKYILKESVKNRFNFFHQWILVSNLSIAQATDGMKYPADVLPLTNISQQMYCALLEVPDKSLDIRMTYQRYKYKKERIAAILDRLYRLTEIALDNPTCSVEEICSMLREERN